LLFTGHFLKLVCAKADERSLDRTSISRLSFLEKTIHSK